MINTKLGSYNINNNQYSTVNNYQTQYLNNQNKSIYATSYNHNNQS